MLKQLLASAALLLLLTGCNDANVRPDNGGPEAVNADPHSSEGRAEIAAMLGGDPIQPLEVTRGDMSGSLQGQLDQLNGRLTLLQEQVIQIRSLTQQVLEQSQMSMTQLQSLRDTQRGSGQTPAGYEEDLASHSLEGMVQEIDQAVAQLLSAMSMQSPQLAESTGPYRVATAYTQRGWILIRYHAQTGETWLADNNDWSRLRDSGSLSPSSYEVQVQRADQDRKGYVAVRIDRRTGQSWWLSDDTWQVLN
ncbi:hypothetical protein ADINL_2187 [Nitrincola lacisaponensis]|uniref:Lipoprotein n=1 Tax=Nitrincola lacisaponensis TaxID=267850 RepID=A0A063XY43_9GAMM|nr:hypothetical protein [Nitrincola lacisaponensis]KDE39058.1 hypothetical protein ADINL_2187 [Nitrincola lacisaponensis]